MTRRAIVCIPYRDVSLAFEVTYHWSGRYRLATREEPEEYPTIEIDSSTLVEFDESLPTWEQVREHEDLKLIDRKQFGAALIEADAEKYPVLDRDDVQCFGHPDY